MFEISWNIEPLRMIDYNSNMDTKLCRDCGQVKLITDFVKRSTSKDGLHYYCRVCSGIRVRSAMLGMPADLLREAEDKFTGTCDICKLPIEGRNRHMDHDHKKMSFRGWLCRNCNIGIGQFKEDVQLVKRAVQYLEAVLEDVEGDAI